MNCYRFSCKSDCDNTKKMYCIYKLSEKQQMVIASIRKNSCVVCGSETVASKYSFIDTRLCTSCGTLAIDDVVVRSCLVNGRRVS